MNKTGVIVVGAGATVGVAALLHFLTKTGTTAGKLDIIVDEFGFSGKKGKSGILFNAKLRINNPTNHDLRITQPYLKVFYKDTTDPIGLSPVSKTTYELKAKEATPIEVNVEFPNSKVFPKMPDILTYLLKRVAGAPSTRKAVIQILVAGNGINQTIVKPMSI